MTRGIYSESGVNIDLRRYSPFRFEDCGGYRKLKGFNVKEIDFGWWNESEKCLYLLEIKDYTANPGRLTGEKPADGGKEPSDILKENLLKKSIDVLLMLSAVWLGTNGSREIKSCFPIQAQHKCNVKIFHLIKCDKSLEPLLHQLNDRLKSEFRGYKILYENLCTFTIISARQAEKIFKDLISFNS